MPVLIPLISLLISLPSAAQVLAVDLQKLPEKGAFTDLYQIKASGKASKLAPLSQLKMHEINRNWSGCIGLAPSVFGTQPQLRGWVALTWANCLDKHSQVTLAQQEAFLMVLGKNRTLLQEGPWSSELARAYIQRSLSVYQTEISKKRTAVAAEVETLLTSGLSLSSEQRAQIFQILGDVALQKVHYAQAQFLFEQSYNLNKTQYVGDKLNFLYKVEGDSKKEKASGFSSEVLTEDEEIAKRIEVALGQKDQIAALKDMVLLLSDYSSSQSARKYKDQPLDIFYSVKEAAPQQKVLREMGNASFESLLDWGANLYRRAQYEGALFLYQKAYAKNSQSPQTAFVLAQMGRSAQFLGRYDKALDHFATVIKNHGGSAEYYESLFRSALIRFRLGDYSSAAANLEKLILSESSRWDLQARYWFVRSLEQTNKTRAQEQAKLLVQRYPFTYYGLRLSAEQNEGSLLWPQMTAPAPLKSSVIYLAGSQKSAWNRFLALSKAGWINEARQELGAMPFIKDPLLKVTLAEKLAQRSQYLTAISLINSALDEATELNQEKYVRIGFPQAFASIYQQEGERYSLHPAFLQSLTRQESGFNLQAVSSAKAMGLMQMIPGTAQEVAQELYRQSINLPEDLFRPEINIPMGTYYISKMVGQFKGNIPFALAAYNAGPTRMRTWMQWRPELSAAMESHGGTPLDELWFDELPWSETSFYVKAILRNSLIYRLLDNKQLSLGPVLWADLVTKKTAQN